MLELLFVCETLTMPGFRRVLAVSNLFEHIFDRSMKCVNPKIDDYLLSALFYLRLVGPCQIIFDAVAF